MKFQAVSNDTAFSVVEVFVMKWLRWGIRAIIAVAALHVIFFLFMLVKMLNA